MRLDAGHFAVGHTRSMPGALVQLWMYDLSKGMARHVSKYLSRREIDGIW